MGQFKQGNRADPRTFQYSWRNPPCGIIGLSSQGPQKRVVQTRLIFVIWEMVVSGYDIAKSNAGVRFQTQNRDDGFQFKALFLIFKEETGVRPVARGTAWGMLLLIPE